MRIDLWKKWGGIMNNNKADQIIEQVEKMYISEVVHIQLLKAILRRLDELELKIDLLK